VTHAIVEEREQVDEDGVRWFVLRCECGERFDFAFLPGFTPRRSARAAYRRHSAEAARGRVRIVAFEVQGDDATVGRIARMAGALIEDGDEDD
jgi:hypothetical protein